MHWLIIGGLVLAVVKVMFQRRQAGIARLDRRAHMTGARPDTVRARYPR